MPARNRKNKLTTARAKIIYKILALTLILLVLPLTLWAIKNPRNILNQFASVADDINKTRTTYDVPVMIIMYLPDTNNDGIVDKQTTNWEGFYDIWSKKRFGTSVNDLRNHIMDDAKRGIEFLTTASKYKGYKDLNAIPSLRYQLIENRIYEEKINPPPGKLAWGGPDHAPDYNAILKKYNICDLVDKEGIKEVWMWTQHAGGISPNESNFSSKLSGDVSNSERYQDDLPLCNKSYTLYNYNFTRGWSELIHNHGHQLEHLYNQWPRRDTLPESQWSSLLFWGRFVGSQKNHEISRPGCGWIHEPPNVPEDPNIIYIYNSTNVRKSDCENWLPNGKGVKSDVSCYTYQKYFYGNNINSCIDDGGLSFYMWWMQNLPGYGNDLYDTNGKKLRNWWDYVGDFDALYRDNNFLYTGLGNTGPDTVMPQVNILSPSWGSELSGIATITTKAVDNKGIVSHKILIDNTGSPITVLSDCKTSEDCTYNLDIDNLVLKDDGKLDYFVIVVEARDAANNLGRKYIEVKAQKNIPSDTISPVVSIVNPVGGSNLSGVVSFSANASDVSGIASIKMLIDSTVIKTCQNSSSCSINYDTKGLSNGVYTFKVIAIDSKNNEGSGVVNINISNSPPPVDNILPKVSIGSPIANSTIKGTVEVKASASDTSGISSIRIIIDNIPQTTCTNATICSYTWNTSTYTNATHTLKVEAVDKANLTGSTTINVIVNNVTLSSADGKILTPENLSQINLPVVFNWSPGINAGGYYLFIGRKQGTSDLFSSSYAKNTTSATINASNLASPLSSGASIYVSLWTITSRGSYLSNSYVYTVK